MRNYNAFLNVLETCEFSERSIRNEICQDTRREIATRSTQITTRFMHTNI